MKKFNFKWCVYILLCAMLLPVSMLFITPKGVASAEGFIVNEQQGEITSITGDFVGMKVNSYQDVYLALNNFKSTFNFKNSEDSLVFTKQVKSLTGTVYRFYQKVQGLKVFGSEVIVNTNQDGRIMSINCSYFKNIALNKEVNHSIEEATKVVKSQYEATKVVYLEENIFPSEENCRCYVFEVHMYDDVYNVLVCANHLEVVKVVKSTASLDDVMMESLPSLQDYTKIDSTITYTNVNGQSVALSVDKYQSKTSSEYFYILGDKERAVYITHGQNQKNEEDALYYASKYESGYFNDTVAVRAYDYIMQCYDFYLDETNFGCSIDGLKNPNGKDISLLAIVHYDRNYENAAFYLPNDNSTTGYFYFGDGNISKGTGSFVNGLDVVGHEYQHCITDSIVKLQYLNEAGAICEAYSDIFGACIEGYELSDENFWKMGEDIYLSENKFFRDIANPASTGCTYSYEKLYPLCTSLSCAHTNCDNGGVHYNSTLMTYATYIMYQRDPSYFTKTNILKLWYQTLTKLGEQSTFLEFAELMMQSAQELNVPESNILDIEFAFATIDLPGYSGVKIWGDYSLQYLQGEGNIVYPYLINSVADLASVAYYVNDLGDKHYASARYKINTDLNLNNNLWIGIGTKENPFNGVFNGGGKTISGLNIAGNQGDVYSGLFNYTGETSYIYDVRIASGNVSSNAQYTGAIAGLLQGTISGCSSELNIIGKNVGGLVGLVNNISGEEKVVNSFTTADLEGDIVGGLVSVFSTPLNNSVNLHLSGYITSSYTTGSLTGNIVGGIVGSANGLYLANVLTIATIQGLNSESVLGGLIGELSFKQVLNKDYDVSDVVSNMILGSKIASHINTNNNEEKQGLLVGEVLYDVNFGTLYVENLDVKKIDSISYFSNAINEDFVKLVDVNLTTDNKFEGCFDFDNDKYYKNHNNWTIINGIEAFDLVSTFEVAGENKMPKFIEADFWLNHSAYGFDSGTGTQNSPYIIKTAEQLALLASRVGSASTNLSFANKHYKLGADIDLSGKIWVGIGATDITVRNSISSGVIYPFTGTFDGNGYSILNMSSVGAYMVQALNSDGSNYKMTEFLPSLFGTTNIYESFGEIINPTIKNLVVENVNNRGSYASGVVSKVYNAITIENVSVKGGNITSSFISGGLVANIDGLGQSLSSENIVSTINNCDAQVNVSGRISGGAVGYVTNASKTINSSLNIINFLNKGKIAVTGEELDSEQDMSSSYYYRPIGGSVIGLTLIRNLNIINAINLGEVISYNYGGYVGGLIGATGIDGSYSQMQMNILIDGCKEVGLVHYVYTKSIFTEGSIIGATHANFTGSISLVVTNKTYTNKKYSVVGINNSNSITIESSIQTSEDVVGEGDFDVYNKEYYTNSDYFNDEYYWGLEQQAKMFLSVTFRDYDGTIIDVVYLDKGQTSLTMEETPVPNRISTGQYEYVFKGWDKSLESITQSINVYAEYETVVKSYTITYVDEKGNIIETKTLKFGASVNQNIEAPKKENDLLFEYEFLRWGEKGQTVTGDMKITPTYKKSFSNVGKFIIVSAGVITVTMLYLLNKKQKEKTE